MARYIAVIPDGAKSIHVHTSHGLLTIRKGDVYDDGDAELREAIAAHPACFEELLVEAATANPGERRNARRPR